jgi:hypothetical protein
MGKNTSMVITVTQFSRGWRVALSAISMVEPSILVLPGFTPFGRSQARSGSRTWHWDEIRFGIGWAGFVQIVFNGGILVLLGFTGRGANMGKRRLALEKGGRSGCFGRGRRRFIGRLILVLPGFTEFDRAGFSEDAGWGHPAYKARFDPRFHVLV